jgi:hypothetical protein
MTTTAALRTYLETLDEADLAQVLVARRLLARGTVVVDLDHMVQRLTDPQAVADAVADLSSHELTVLEVLAALGARSSADRLDAALLTTERNAVRDVVQSLERLALVWRDAAGSVHTTPGLEDVIHSPLGLGPTARGLVCQVAWDPGVEAALDDPSRLVALLDEAPSDVVLTLRREARVRVHKALARPVSERIRLVVGEFRAETDTLTDDRPSPDYEAALRWAVDHGWGFVTRQGVVRVPAEVLMAATHVVVPVVLEPCEPGLAATTAAAVEDASAAARAEAVHGIDAVLDLAAAQPLRMLKSVGVGIREMRRVARVTSTDVTTVRLALELGFALGLVLPAEAGLAVTDRHADWCTWSLGKKAGALSAVWLDLSFVVTVERDRYGPMPAICRFFERGHAEVRTAALHYAASLPEGRGIADVHALQELLAWGMPFCRDAVELLPLTWREAEVLGLVAFGRLSRFGIAALEGRFDDELVAAEIHRFADLLPGESRWSTSDNPDVDDGDVLDARRIPEPEAPEVAARRLRAGGLPPGYPGTNSGDVVPGHRVDISGVMDAMPHLDARQVAMLVRAAVEDRLVRIRYRAADGAETERDLWFVRILPPHLYAACQLRHHDRILNLRGVIEVVGLVDVLRTAGSEGAEW